MKKDELVAKEEGDDFELIVKIRNLPRACNVDELIDCAGNLKKIDQNGRSHVIYWFIFIFLILLIGYD